MSRDATRRILDEFGSDSSIEGLEIDVRPWDLALFLPAVFVAILAYELAGVPGHWAAQGVGIVVGVGAILATAVLIFVTPEGETSTVGWVTQMLAFWRSDKERSVVDANPKNRTDTLTQVSKFHPDTGAVERTDGDVVGGVRVEPANMSLATDQEWNAAADAFGDALNSLEFDVFIHSTGRTIDVDAVVDEFEGREDDPDVQANDTLQDLVGMYQTLYRNEFKTDLTNTSVREYYVLVPVGEREVQMEDYGAFSKLTSLPFVGNVIKTIAGAASRMTGAETQAAQNRELASRVEDVEDAIRGVDGCSTEVLSAEELAGAIEEFWTGQRSEYDTGEARMRSVPVVVSETNDAVDDAE